VARQQQRSWRAQDAQRLVAIGGAGEKVMTANTVLDQRELQLAREAAEWRLISLLFECPSESWRAQLAGLAKEIADPELKSAVKAALEEAEEGLFHYVFGPGGPAPAREATYHQTVELGYLMSELQAYYNAFAFHPQTAEAPDFVSVEAGFIAYLKLKELYALACRNEDQAMIARDAAKDFLRDHLAMMAQPLASRLEDSGITYLAKAGAALSQRVGPPPAPPATPLPILQEQEGDEGFVCGNSYDE
jgi:nitrate reductase assembly molybdenum cofactor insertion protein NarJ